MITPEALSAKVDKLFSMPHIPNIRFHCSKVSQDAMDHLNRSAAALQALLTQESQSIRDRSAAAIHKQQEIFQRFEAWTHKSGNMTRQMHRENEQLVGRVEQLNAIVEHRKQELARRDQERWAALQLEVMQLLAHCQRQVAAVGEPSMDIGFRGAGAGGQQQQPQQPQQQHYQMQYPHMHQHQQSPYGYR